VISYAFTSGPEFDRASVAAAAAAAVVAGGAFPLIDGPATLGCWFHGIDREKSTSASNVIHRAASA
jgi:hypothetical protein